MYRKAVVVDAMYGQQAQDDKFVQNQGTRKLTSLLWVLGVNTGHDLV